MDNILFLNIKDLNDKEYLKLSFENFFQKKFFFKPKILVSNKGYRYKADWIRKSIKLIPKEFKSLIPSRFKLFIKSKVITSKNTRYIPTQEELIILHELLDEDYSLFENKYLK